MGLRSLFGGKKLIDRLTKYFNENKITLNEENNKYSFELFLKESDYALYPYFILDDDKGELSIVINLRKAEKNLSNEDFIRINSFNLKSKYFTARISTNNVIYLEYNSMVNADNIKELFINVIQSVFDLQEEIDTL